MPSHVTIGSLSVAAYNTSGGTQGSTPGDGEYYPTKTMPGGPPWFSSPEIREVQHDFASIPGIGTTRFKDFGKVRIHVAIIFVSSTKDGAVARYNTALTAFKALARYTIVVNGQTFKGKLVPGSAQHINSDFIGGKFHETYGFVFEHLG